MSLAAGFRLGQYEIESAIAAGGMGEVYRALDTRLGRRVAIKVLRGDSGAADSRRRFQREARAVSSLNHPHILTVHDAGELDGRQYLVTELVEGGTLRDWSTAKPRTWRQIVELLTGVADGLAAAHAAGILHRDVKPENVLVDANGYARLADFGLAKLREPLVVASTDRTAPADHTRPGMLMGTIGYMSPEQASGRPVDERSDVFSFGAMLYELLAGKRPFAGATYLDVLLAIAHSAPEALDPNLPPALRLLVEKALEKDPADRYQSMRELVVDLKRVARHEADDAGGIAPKSLPRPPPAKRPRVAALAIAAAALAVAAIAGGRYLFRDRAQVSAPVPDAREYERLTDFADSAVSPALSQDGRLLTYIRGDSTFVGPGEVYVQLLPSGDPVQLTDDGLQKISPVFSPDGSRIAYGIVRESLDWETWVVPVLGGQPRLMLKNSSGLNWIPSSDGLPRILFSELTGNEIQMALTTATESRLEARRVHTPDGRGMVHRSALSPDGRWVLMVYMYGGGWSPCQLAPFGGEEPRRSVGPPSAPCTDAAWSPDGEWIYLSADAGNGFHIWRQLFPDGAPEQVTFGVTEEQGIAFAPDGRSFITSIGGDQNTIWIHEPSGDRQITSQGYAYLPRFAPHGHRLFYLLRSGSSSRTWVKGRLHVADLGSGESEPLFADFQISDYDLSPDGASIVFASVIDDADSSPLWLAPLDGGSPPRPLGGVEVGRAVFGPAGDLFFVEEGALHRVATDGSGRRRVLDRVNYVYDISPDGDWAAVWRDQGVVLQSLARGDAIELCSRCGTVGAENLGVTPPVVTWSRDGRHLYMHSAWTTRETYVIPLEAGRVAPDLGAAGLRSAEEVAARVGAEPLAQMRAFPSDDPEVYAFMRASARRNIYRVPVH